MSNVSSLQAFKDKRDEKMISDVLSDAVRGLDYYFNRDNSPYQGERRERLLKLRGDMDSMRCELDGAPNAAPEVAATTKEGE